MTSLRGISNSEQAEQAGAILNTLETAIPNKYMRNLSPICVGESDLSSTLFLEWIFPKGRLGFNIEIDPKESGWYLLIEQPDGQLLRDWGYMASFDAGSAVSQILSQNFA